MSTIVCLLILRFCGKSNTLTPTTRGRVRGWSRVLKSVLLQACDMFDKETNFTYKKSYVDAPKLWLETEKEKAIIKLFALNINKTLK